MIELNDANGPAYFKEGRNYMLMFYTKWCRHCPPLAKALDALQKEMARAFELVFINFDENPEAVECFNASGVPAVFAVKGNAVLAGWVGVFHKDVYRRAAEIAFTPPDKALSRADMDTLLSLGKSAGLAQRYSHTSDSL